MTDQPAPPKDVSDPAFPIAANEYGGNGPHFGMSLRDYFAAAALTGLANGSLTTDPQTIGNVTLQNMKTPIKEHDIATWAYMLADAMLHIRIS